MIEGMPRRISLALAALLIAAFAGLMLTKTLPYYTFEKNIHFLTTKNDETNDNPCASTGLLSAITDVYKELGIEERSGESNPKYAKLDWNEAWENQE